MLLDCRKPTLARSFIRASSQGLSYAGLPVSAIPSITMACWAWSSDTTNAQNMISFGRTANFSDYLALQFRGDVAGDPIRFAVRGGGGTSIDVDGSGYLPNRWYHAAATMGALNSHAVYVNGVGTTSTTSTTAFSLTSLITTIGYYAFAASANYLSGQIAWPAIWNIALSAADIALLAKGAHPTTIHPESLVAFWDWTGATYEPGIKGIYPLTNSGSTPVTGPAFLHTRIPRPWMLGSGYVAASGNRRRRQIICGAAA